MRRIELRGEPHLQWTQQHAKQQTHENLTIADSIQRAAELFSPTYRHAHLFTSEADVSARITRDGNCRLVKSAPSKRPAERSTSHNRQKQYLIPEGVPCPFLETLGIMTADGRVKQARQHKFRQINRYLEFVDDVYEHLPADGPLHVVDFGCGLSYLTFALHHLLTSIHGRDVQIRGIDQNPTVIERCIQTAADLGLVGLEFVCRAIDSAAVVPMHPADTSDRQSLAGTACPPEAVPSEIQNRLAGGQAVARHPATPEYTDQIHLAVSLHACDTATDDALAAAVRLGADVIFAAPCCQHELFTQLESDALTLLTRHGILKERFAALATDALRAAVLEQAGYRTQVIEFIETEHTPKNLLLRAVRRKSGSPDPQLATRIGALKQLLGIDQTRLERLIS